METIRILSPALLCSSSRSLPHVRCNAADCNRATKGGKPFCSEHVLLMPYVRQLRGGA